MSDFGALEELLGSRAVMKSSVNGPLSENQIWDWLEEQLRVYESNQGIEVLAVVNKYNLELIGYCGLFHFSNIDGVSEIEIGYRFVENSWGNGYATEVAILGTGTDFNSDLQGEQHTLKDSLASCEVMFLLLAGVMV